VGGDGGAVNAPGTSAFVAHGPCQEGVGSREAHGLPCRVCVEGLPARNAASVGGPRCTRRTRRWARGSEGTGVPLTLDTSAWSGLAPSLACDQLDVADSLPDGLLPWFGKWVSRGLRFSLNRAS
jgi:hypothetical protein